MPFNPKHLSPTIRRRRGRSNRAVTSAALSVVTEARRAGVVVPGGYQEAFRRRNLPASRLPVPIPPGYTFVARVVSPRKEAKEGTMFLSEPKQVTVVSPEAKHGTIDVTEPKQVTVISSELQQGTVVLSEPGASGEHVRALRPQESREIGISEISHMVLLQDSDISMTSCMSQEVPVVPNAPSSPSNDSDQIPVACVHRDVAPRPIVVFLVNYLCNFLQFCLGLLHVANYVTTFYACLVTICAIFLDEGLMMHYLTEYNVNTYVADFVQDMFLSHHDFAIVIFTALCVHLPLYRTPPSFARMYFYFAIAWVGTVFHDFFAYIIF